LENEIIENQAIIESLEEQQQQPEQQPPAVEQPVSQPIQQPSNPPAGLGNMGTFGGPGFDGTPTGTGTGMEHSGDFGSFE
ncbi:MAG: hypothetical protein NC331_13475, partial [Lachnospiraceae bacterium]|nr:hypothetical protein [Lachnospiraceae bacterium]MCM1240375.1 hypothetical protein [Lachnospiraceae bacterium]